MIVTRVQDTAGSHIEPPLDELWDDFTKLRWHGAVVALDTGLTVIVRDGARLREDGKPMTGWYGVIVGGSGIAALDYRCAWDYLTGVSVGVQEAARALDIVSSRKPPNVTEGDRPQGVTPRGDHRPDRRGGPSKVRRVQNFPRRS